MARSIIVLVVVLILLPFALGLISSFAWSFVRLSFSRVRTCEHCSRRALVFVEGLRPLHDAPIDPSDLTRAYYECRDCGARFSATLWKRGLEQVDAERWRKVLATKWFYARGSARAQAS